MLHEKLHERGVFGLSSMPFILTSRTFFPCFAMGLKTFPYRGMGAPRGDFSTRRAASVSQATRMVSG